MKFLKHHPSIFMKWLKDNRLSAILAIAGLLFLIAGMIFETAFLPHLMTVLQTSVVFFFTLAVSGMLLVSVHFLSNAKWSDQLLPTLLKTGKLLLYLPLFFIILLAFYRIGAQQNLLDPVQKVYFNSWFLTGRTLLICYLFYYFQNRFVLLFENKEIKKLKNTSAIFILIFPFIFMFFTFDWLSGSIPGWINSIHIFYQVAGLLNGGFALALIIYLRRIFSNSTNDNKLIFNYNSGRYILLFSSLWAYTWISRLLISWYASIPAEAEFYMAGSGFLQSVLFFVNPLLNFLIPFILLLSKKIKEKEKALLFVSVLVIAGRWIDQLSLAGIDKIPGKSYLTLVGILLMTLAIITGFTKSVSVNKTDDSIKST